jgi:hypothetical protein
VVTTFVGWKGTVCLECGGKVDQHAGLGYWVHTEGPSYPHDIVPSVPNGPLYDDKIEEILHDG